jgi:hypothetical protein
MKKWFGVFGKATPALRDSNQRQLKVGSNFSAMIRDFKSLKVYQVAFEAAKDIFIISKSFPAEEKYSLTDQIKRSSRSVCTCIGEGY